MFNDGFRARSSFIEVSVVLLIRFSEALINLMVVSGAMLERALGQHCKILWDALVMMRIFDFQGQIFRCSSGWEAVASWRQRWRG